MPTQSEVDSVRDQIEILTQERSFLLLGETRVAVAPHARGNDEGHRYWGELGQYQQFAVLTSEVRWLGFEATEIVEVSRRVVDGESPEFWFDDIAVTDRAERREELFAEMREEEYFRRHGEPPGPRDVEREADAVASFYPDAANDNAPAWQPTFDAMVEAIANPPRFESEYEKALQQAAEMARGREQDRDNRGPER